MDVQLACVSFYVNNVPVVRESDAEVAAKKGKGKYASAYPISTPGVTRFRPAVYMYSPRASKLAQVGHSCCLPAKLLLFAQCAVQITFDFTMLGGVALPLHEPLSRYG